LRSPQYVVLNASRLWAESGHDQKQRLQKVICPEGVRFEDGIYRTTATSMTFFDLAKISDQKESLVAQTLTRWNHITAWLEEVNILWQNGKFKVA
jgi:hypothetical protein